MRRDFVERVLQSNLDRGVLTLDSSILAVCAGNADEALFADLGFTNVTLTNIDVVTGNAMHGTQNESTAWRAADVQALDFDDQSFDLAFVSDGLHHCRSPHRAVTEMYRVARRGVLVIESRDSLAMRAAVKLGLTWHYEFNPRLLSTRTNGGVDFGPVPNYVYRWTEREFEKLLCTYDPEHDLRFCYYHDLALPGRMATNPVLSTARAVFRAVMPRQGNSFGLLALRGELKPYLEGSDEGGYVLRASVADPTVQRASASTRSRPRV